MAESKMLKARCRKTGRLYGLELKKVGSDWKVVNMIDLSAAEYSVIMSEVKQPVFETNNNLIACSKCGNRQVGACSCARKVFQCSNSMKYKFDCTK